MSYTMTDLFPDMYRAMDVVSKEPVGLLGAVSIDADVERVAANVPIRSYITREETAIDFTPGQLAPNTGDATLDNVTLTIDKQRMVAIRWNGADQKKLNSSFGTYRTVFQSRVEQALRTLRNEMEADLAALYVKASRAVSPAGTTLFDAANYKDVANARKLLLDNGAPLNDMSLVLSTTAGAALRGNAQYAGANTAGREDIIRQGILLDVHGVMLRESSKINSHTAGTASSATTDNAGYAIGATTITLAAAGTGTILAGDVITFAGDTNKYVVTSGDADVSGGGTITIAKPGLKKALAASTVAITVVSDAERNMIFSRNAIHLATRMIDMPEGGDNADEVETLIDPMTGMAFEIRKYREFGQVNYFVCAAWGKQVVKTEHLCLLID